MTCRAMLTTANGRELTCDLPSMHEGPHSGLAPRRYEIRLEWDYDLRPAVTDADQ